MVIPLFKIRSMKYYLLSLMFIISSVTCIAQVTSDSPESILDNFFKVYQKEGAKAAVENIYTYSDSSMQQSRDYVRDTLFHTAEPLGGKYLGNELIAKKVITPSLVAYTYIVKYGLAPIRLTFMFYKPRDKWMLQHFSFDSNLFSEVYKATRIEGQK